MPLSTPAPRELLHERSIDCHGYRRDDGLWDIEGHMVDVKTYDFANRFRGTIKAGEPVHDMWLRLTVDDDLLIHACEAFTAHGPYAECPAVNHAYAALAGIRIGPGWRRAVRARVGGVAGCTHLTELLGPLATTAYQTVLARKQRKHEEGTASENRPFWLDSCHALASDGPVVRVHAPEHYTGKESA